MTSAEQFRVYLDSPEGSRIEFKEAKGNFYFEELVQYCVALANEGGGKVVLGITDRRPRSVVGTAAFSRSPVEPRPGCSSSCISGSRSKSTHTTGSGS